MDMSDNALQTHDHSDSLISFYNSVEKICLEGLTRTLDPREGVFNRQLRDGRVQPTVGAEDLTSTCICLISMDRRGDDNKWGPLGRSKMLESMYTLAMRRDYAGAFGLVAWANAVNAGPEIDLLADRVGISLSADLPDLLTTMELAWLLSGLLHEAQRTGKERDRKRASDVTQALRLRYNPSVGLMRHATEKAPLRARVRRNVANFADQIYTIQALAFAGIVNSDPLDIANSVSHSMVARQGSLGQWWWHYDSLTGETAERYPVYSVHQHAMAPMALMALARAGGSQYEKAISKSISWLHRNELAINMVDLEARTIWRDIHRNENYAQSQIRNLRELLRWREPANLAPAQLELNRETRPYEWAWCLYARELACGSNRRGHIV